MPDSITSFFNAWQLDNAAERLDVITRTTTTSVQYDDPRMPDTLVGANALCDYLGMFSANAPGWTAKVVKSDTNNGMVRVTVSFSGNGPDGTKQTQYGQYFVEKEGGQISRMVGFVGTGDPE